MYFKSTFLTLSISNLCLYVLNTACYLHTARYLQAVFSVSDFLENLINLNLKKKNKKKKNKNNTSLHKIWAIKPGHQDFHFYK